MPEFTVIESTLGGVILGCAVAANLLCFGRVTGISGIVGELVRPSDKTQQSKAERSWRVLFVSGLVLGGVFAAALDPSFPEPLDLPASIYVLAGVTVGIGTRVGNG
jgi:uncharacterized membrane protein YedE/YeeE